MKTKTIKKILKSKIEKWLLSIDDPEVKSAIERDFIITGGSIASMLIQQDVNDFDIYFKTESTTKLVSEYYINKINKIYVNRISDSKIQVISSTNIPKSKYSNEDELNMWNQFVEGLKRSNENRVKIYIPHVGYWRKTNEPESLDTTQPEIDSYEPIYITENAITLSDDIQIVVRFFGDVTEIHKNYDFAHATSYFHKNGGCYELVLRPQAMEALLTRELLYIGSKYPLTSIIRTKKFLQRGFSISAGTYLKIMWQVAELDLKDPIVLQEQLMGVDVAYFSILIGIISKTDKSNLTYGYISEIIERVFNEVE
jgi:general stress protein 26